jgi:hypothetical protein
MGSAREFCCLSFQAAASGERCNENKKLAGSLASPANEIMACRYTIKKRRCLTPAAPAPGCTATCTCQRWHPDPYPTNATATATATADAASAASAGSASAAAATTTAAGATASTAATASAGQLHAAEENIVVVEETEGSEADVGNFLFTERDHHPGREILPLLNVTGRHRRCRCASC